MNITHGEVFVNEFLKCFEFGLRERIDHSKWRRSAFFQIDLEVIRSMFGKSISLGFTEDISEVMIFL